MTDTIASIIAGLRAVPPAGAWAVSNSCWSAAEGWAPDGCRPDEWHHTREQAEAGASKRDEPTWISKIIAAPNGWAMGEYIGPFQTVKCACGAGPSPSESPGTGTYEVHGVVKFICYACWCVANYELNSCEIDAAADLELSQRQADWGCDRGISGPWRLEFPCDLDIAWLAEKPSSQRQTHYSTRASAARAMRGNSMGLGSFVSTCSRTT
jgi:hypothetical protein